MQEEYCKWLVMNNQIYYCFQKRKNFNNDDLYHLYTFYYRQSLHEIALQLKNWSIYYL